MLTPYINTDSDRRAETVNALSATRADCHANAITLIQSLPAGYQLPHRETDPQRFPSWIGNSHGNVRPIERGGQVNRQRTLDFPSGLVRTSDPPESHQAVREIIADGTHGRMLQITLEAVKNTPGLTSNELEMKHGYRDGQLRKRLTELEAMGLVVRGPVRRSEVTSKNNVTWNPGTV